MRRRSALRGALALATIGIPAWGACTSIPPPEPPAPRLGDIARRHWDQVCGEDVEATSFVSVSELFDTVGLGAEVERGGPWPKPTSTRVVHASLDFVTRYARDGRVALSGAWDATVPPEAVASLSEILEGRVQPLEPLLEREGFHTRLTLTPTPRLSVRPPITCIPHLIHPEGAPPTGLPDSVRTWVGRLPRRDTGSRVSVLVETAPDGRVIQVSPTGGTEDLFPAASAVIGALAFDPAVRNGEAVPGRLPMIFDFRR